MKDNIEQEGDFQDEIEKVVNRFREEYDLTYAEMIGQLEIVKQNLFLELVGPQLDDRYIRN